MGAIFVDFLYLNIFRQYEVAMGAGQAMGDRLAQMEAMDGAARCLEALRWYYNFFIIAIKINICCYNSDL